MVHVGLDLSRTRLDVHVMDESGAPLAVTMALPEAGGLAALVSRIGAEFGGPVYAAIESMNGARFVHDQLEMAGWQVEIADAQKVKGLAPLACKSDKIDSWVLAELSRRGPGSAGGAPPPGPRSFGGAAPGPVARPGQPQPGAGRRLHPGPAGPAHPPPLRPRPPL